MGGRGTQTAPQNKPQTQPLALHEDEGESRKPPSDNAEPSCPLAGSKQHPQAWLAVLFPYVQFTEMLNPFPFQHLIFYCPLNFSRASLTGSPKRHCPAVHTNGGKPTLDRSHPCQSGSMGRGAGERASISHALQLIFAHTDLTADLRCPEQGRRPRAQRE